MKTNGFSIGRQPYFRHSSSASWISKIPSSLSLAYTLLCLWLSLFVHPFLSSLNFTSQTAHDKLSNFSASFMESSCRIASLTAIHYPVDRNKWTRLYHLETERLNGSLLLISVNVLRRGSELRQNFHIFHSK